MPFHPLRMDLRILLLSGAAGGGGDGGRSEIDGRGEILFVGDLRVG